MSLGKECVCCAVGSVVRKVSSSVSANIRKCTWIFLIRRHFSTQSTHNPQREMTVLEVYLEVFMGGWKSRGRRGGRRQRQDLRPSR